MALGVTVDFTANIARFSSQVDRLTGDLNRFQQRAETMSSRVSKAFGAIGVGLSIAGIGAFLKSGIDAADALSKLADKTGITVEALSGLDHATRLADTNIQSFADASNKLSINIAKNRDEFARLGISAKDPVEAFLQFADVFNSIKDSQDRAAFGAKVLGRAYADMAPLISQGSAALREQIRVGKEMSGITTEQAKAAADFNDQLTTMQERIASLSIRIGGPILEGFNQLADKIGAATQSGVTFNNVMRGIGDFAFQNVYDDVEHIGTISKEVNALNDDIVASRERLDKLKHRSVLFKPVFGADTAVIAANEKLNGLLLQRDQLLIHQSESRKKTGAGASLAAPSSAAVQKFIGAGGGSKSSAGRSHSAARTAVDQLQQSYQSMLASLEKEIALRDANGEAAKLEYEIINGNLRGLAPAQAENLLALAREKDALELQDKQWAALIESANEYYDLRKSNDDLIKYGGIQEGFNEALARTQDQLQAGNINADQAKAEFDKLGNAWNDEYIKPAMEGQDQLSEYAIQAARNMQTSFADFLFDPFKDGVGGMIENFATALRRMAADYISSQLFDLLKNGFSASGSSGSSGAVDTGVGILGAAASLYGGSSGAGYSGFSSASTAATSSYLDSSFTYGAKGRAFADGNVIPFAKGGDIVNRPVNFRMKGGKTGLMGEAGPEAIMPLLRTPSGKLGVSVHGEDGTIVIPISRGPDGKLGVSFKEAPAAQFAAGAAFDNSMPVPVKPWANTQARQADHAGMNNSAPNITVIVQGGNNAPDVRRAAGQGAREALALMGGAQRYG